MISQSNLNKSRALWKIDIYVKKAPWLHNTKTQTQSLTFLGLSYFPLSL